MSIVKRIIIFSFCLFLGAKLFGFVPGNKILQDFFRSNIYYYEDVDENVMFEVVSSDEFQNKFTKNSTKSLDFGFSNSNYWLNFVIENPTSNVKSYYIKIGNSRIQEIEYFELEDKYLLKHVETGNRYTFSARTINRPDFIFPIEIPPHSKKRLFFRINNHGKYLKIPITLFETKKFEASKSVAGNSLLYGILIFIILLNIFSYISYRDSVYLYFIFYATSIFLFHLNITGLLFKYIWPEIPGINNFSGEGFLTLSVLSFLYFTKHFFQIRSISTKLNDIFRVSAGVVLLIMILVLVIDITYLSKFISFFIIIIYVVFIGTITSFDKYYSSFKAAIYYRVSLFVLLVGLLITQYGNHFQISEEFINLFSLKVTLILHFLVLFYGLSERNRQIKEETDEVAEDLETLERERVHEIINQKELLVMQREELLTQKEELEVQKEQLLEYTAQLEKLSLVVKETHNIIYIFDKEGNLEWFNKSFSSWLGDPSYINNKETINIREISHNDKIDDYIDECILKGEPVIYETLAKFESSKKIWYQTTLTPVFNEEGEITKIVAIDSEISQLKEFEQKIGEQKDRVETQKKEITDSIKYAQRIQQAILPDRDVLDKFLKDNFIIFLPKDIVSGDFYWYQKIGNKHFIIAVDCTGHGVPGAFMSIIGTYLLNNIILHNEVYDPAEILKQLNRKIKISLKSDPTDNLSTDGMDISLVVYDQLENSLEYSGALRPLYLMSESNLTEILGDNLPISSDLRTTMLNRFSKHTLKIKKGDSIYLFSDGIVDQFGGKRGKKFLTKRLKQLLSEVNHLSMKEQEKIILNHFYEWKGGFEQIDDILVIGIRF